MYSKIQPSLYVCWASSLTITVLTEHMTVSMTMCSYSLDIEVSVIHPVEEDNYEQLTRDTMHLLRSYDPTKVQHVDAQEGGAGDNDPDYYNAQDQFFKSIRIGFENEGLKIDTPTKTSKCELQISLLLVITHFSTYEGERAFS